MTIPHFASKRITRTSSITLKAPIAKVFPLFNPVREKEWAAGWEPQFLAESTQAQDIEERMVFRTQSPHGHDEIDYIWTISKYLPDQAFIEYTVFTPERLWWITIQCRDDILNHTTNAEITYTFTGLTDKGNAINEKALQVMYAHDLKDWEMAINHYLMTGGRLLHH
jgi:hypothetical protein